MLECGDPNCNPVQLTRLATSPDLCRLLQGRNILCIFKPTVVDI